MHFTAITLPPEDVQTLVNIDKALLNLLARIEQSHPELLDIEDVQEDLYNLLVRHNVKGY